MCTAVSYLSGDHYFGRNLDLDRTYGETVTILPRNYPMHYRSKITEANHYAIIGMACISNDYPLFFDGTNECGLSIAGLNFPGNSVYLNAKKDYDNIAPYELVPWILRQCSTVNESLDLLSRLNIVNIPFSDEYPLTPLHWLLSDANKSVVIEPLSDGVRIYDNPIGVLTNNPPFEYHTNNICNYLNLTHDMPKNRFSDKIELTPYSLGMGTIGLPGDLSSASRFVRAAFTKWNSLSDHTECSSVSQFFHILSSVAQQNGCVKTNDGFEKTIYSSCCNTSRGIYYYTTYNNRRIRAVSIKNVNLDTHCLYSYPCDDEQDVKYLN